MPGIYGGVADLFCISVLLGQAVARYSSSARRPRKVVRPGKPQKAQAGGKAGMPKWVFAGINHPRVKVQKADNKNGIVLKTGFLTKLPWFFLDIFLQIG